ncbi:HN1_G0004010.mRNA.1.CDS.1 [Saccharomyces cerevisiae]|nr:HN1_G0004010.mRNA.1.CDS.1 [Saccharomyces cerevisiae]CAI4568599.1 BAL_1a_G0032030.mRNA.1.CDS.1 [Saccharomyces cerevisiae]CAI7199248.1 BAL_1a_G0032030.mRNA.1.CDS.1 [Saccharomyces cerevisiae]
MRFHDSILIFFSLASLYQHVHGARQVVRPKEKMTTSEEVKPWVRSIYGGQNEIVTPTVIAGVTFSAKPEETPNPLKPWVSLEHDGRPKTIKPEINKGRTKKERPDYSTYFKTVSSHTYSYEELKAHNMGPNEVFVEEEYIDEDDTYVSLNPIVRCTPNLYFNKGLAKDIRSEPFCTPYENSRWKVDKTYFVSWYTRFFTDENSGKVADKVRVHLSYVKENPVEKGNYKRDIPATFFSSEWIDNVNGLMPVEVRDKWLQDQFDRRIVVSVQPIYISDEDFDPLQYGILLYITKGSKVFKPTKEQLALDDAGITNDQWYYVALSIPTVVVVFFVFMYFFLYVNGKNRDFTDVTRKALNKKRRVLGKFSEMKKFKNMKNHKYTELPSYKKTSKQN